MLLIGYFNDFFPFVFESEGFRRKKNEITEKLNNEKLSRIERVDWSDCELKLCPIWQNSTNKDK